MRSLKPPSAFAVVGRSLVSFGLEWIWGRFTGLKWRWAHNHKGGESINESPRNANKIKSFVDLTCHVIYGHVMAIPRGKHSTVVSLEAQAENLPNEVAASPLYGVAMLKIAMELKKADARPVDELIHGVLTRMRLDETEFRRFLESNGGLLRAIAQKRYT
jgi:hypothetical protein